MTLNVPEIKVSVSYNRAFSELQKITSSIDCYSILKEIFDKDTFFWKEEFILLCLNNSNQVIGFYKLSKGGSTGTVVDIRNIFTIAIKCAAVGIIIAHNHPSGKMEASSADKNVTEKIKEAGKFLDIILIDHLILGGDTYLSFADDGLL